MKKIVLAMFTALIAISMVLTACASPNPNSEKLLGRWVSGDGGEIVFKKSGVYSTKEGGEIITGKYSVTGDNLTTEIVDGNDKVKTTYTFSLTDLQLAMQALVGGNVETLEGEWKSLLDQEYNVDGKSGKAGSSSKMNLKKDKTFTLELKMSGDGSDLSKNLSGKWEYANSELTLKNDDGTELIKTPVYPVGKGIIVDEEYMMSLVAGDTTATPSTLDEIKKRYVFKKQ